MFVGSAGLFCFKVGGNKISRMENFFCKGSVVVLWVIFQEKVWVNVDCDVSVFGLIGEDGHCERFIFGESYCLSVF